MLILGLNHDSYISSAALIRDGSIIAAGAEERFTRMKRSPEFPLNSIKFCLDQANCSIEDVDYVVSSWNPGVYFQKYNPLFSKSSRTKNEHLFSIPDNILRLYDQNDKKVDYIFQKIQLFEKECKIYYITHHRAHASNAFFLSPFKDSAILTADGWGEFETGIFGYGQSNKINVMKSVLYPQSVGLFYSTFTEFLGFRPNSDEWKVMALAGLANWNNSFYTILKNDVVTLLPNGEYEFNLTYFKEFVKNQPNLYTEKFISKFGKPRKTNDELETKHYELSAAMQKISEEIIYHMLNWLHKETKSKNIVVSGGFFMNSVLNGRIIDNTPFENIFVSSCPDDSGNSIGAAMYLYNHILGNEKREVLEHNFFGPEYSNDEIKNVLEKYNLKYDYVENIEEYCAKEISCGSLIGYFQGKMEFGQRALGNRSILADPRGKDIKDKINSAIKYRESFRPFAPAIIKDDFQDYFDSGSVNEVPFMEKVYKIKPDKQKLIPAVTHDDGSGRAQTVDKKTNPRFFKLIQEFKKLTGIPIVVNTSFNLNGEPIVCSPTDALRTFFSCGLDQLIMGNYVIKKN